jgi:hypothetical protein
MMTEGSPRHRAPGETYRPTPRPQYRFRGISAPRGRPRMPAWTPGRVAAGAWPVNWEPDGRTLRRAARLGAFTGRTCDQIRDPRADIAQHAPASGLLERVELQREVLIVRGHARIARSAGRRRPAGDWRGYERAQLGLAWTEPCPRSSQKSRTRTLEPTPSVRRIRDARWTDPGSNRALSRTCV